MNEGHTIETNRGAWEVERIGSVSFVTYTSTLCNALTKFSLINGKVVSVNVIMGNTQQPTRGDDYVQDGKHDSGA